ncbi:hypothetical protein AB0H51_21010 [Streptomyces griseoluteus]|uniref:hypothetical protein n=1 Tax=Streptomyces griseoluteus TaxID=29306 RepID=UPI00340E954D
MTARHLEDQAQDPALAPRAEELRALARAMDSLEHDALDAWADLDLMANFARPESMACDVTPATGRRAALVSKTVDALDWLLGALVFMPLIFTWSGLAMATSAYGDLTTADPKAAARPFLQLWQTGFEGHLSGWFEFGHVAEVGSVALLALLALTLLHGNRRAAADRAEQRAEQETRAAMARLVPVLTEAQLILNAHRFASPGRFAEELNKAGGKIQRMHSKALAAQKHLVNAAEVVSEALEKAEERLSKADDSVRPLETAVARMADTVRHSGTAIRTAVRELDQPLTQVGDELRHAVNGHREALDRSRDSLITATNDLRNLLSRTTDRLEATVSGNGDDVRTALTDAAQRVEDSVTLLAATQRSFTTSVEVVGDLHSQLIDGLKAMAEHTEQAAGDSRHAVSGIADRTKALDEAAKRFTALIDVVERAAKDGDAARAAAEVERRMAEDARKQAQEALARAEEILRQASAPTPPVPPASSASPGNPFPAQPQPQPQPQPQRERSDARPHPSSDAVYPPRPPVSLDKAS